MQKMAEQWFQHHCTILKFISSTKSFHTLQLEADEKQRVRTRPSVQQGKLALVDSCMLNGAVHLAAWRGLNKKLVLVSDLVFLFAWTEGQWRPSGDQRESWNNHQQLHV